MGKRPSLRERFARGWVPEPMSGCWLWVAGKCVGYGRIGVNGRTEWAHRVSYELARGPVPEGMELDHLCRNRACVNPDHLEPVTPLENWRRGMAPSAVAVRTNRCGHGHEYTPENTAYTNGQRRCRACAAAKSRRYRAEGRPHALSTTYHRRKLEESR